MAYGEMAPTVQALEVAFGSQVDEGFRMIREREIAEHIRQVQFAEVEMQGTLERDRLEAMRQLENRSLWLALSLVVIVAQFGYIALLMWGER